MGKQVSSIILTLIKTITYSTEDGRNIAKTILQKLFDEMNIGPNDYFREGWRRKQFPDLRKKL